MPCARRVIDHVVYAGPDLDAAVGDFARGYGVTAEPGGRHVGFGTRNALVRLGPQTYLELVGIDSEQAVPAGQRLFGLQPSSAPRFVAWCARQARPLEETIALARRAGYDPGEIIAMSRTRPDGTVLSWRMTAPLDGVLPFFIDWGTSPHPAAALPSGLALAALTLVHPEASRIRTMLDAIGEDAVAVQAGAYPALRVKLN